MFESIKNPKKLIVATVAAGALLAIGSGARAITWDTTSFNCNAPNVCLGSQGTFISSGETLIVDAFATPNNDGTGNFQNATVKYWSPGLGVTSSGENTGSPQHTLDNNGKNEILVFQFSDAFYTPTNIFLNAFGDTDVDIWIGGSGPIDFTTLSYATLGANGFTACLAGNSGGNSSRSVDLTSCNLSGQYLIVGADNNSSNDYIKIKSISGTETEKVPEPSALILVALGLLGIGSFAERNSHRG